MNARQRDFLLIGLSVFGGWCLAAFLPWKVVAGHSQKDWVEALAAFGAIGAVMATLAVYYFQKQNKAQEDRAIGALAFIRLRVRLNICLGIAAHIVQACEGAAKINERNAVQGVHALPNLRKKCAEAFESVSPLELEQLTKLGGSPVHRFARGLEQLRLIDAELPELINGNAFFALGNSQQVQFYGKWANWAELARAEMLSAINEFEELSA